MAVGLDWTMNKAHLFIYGLATMQYGSAICYVLQRDFKRAAFWTLLGTANLIFTRF